MTFILHTYRNFKNFVYFLFIKKSFISLFVYFHSWFFDFIWNIEPFFLWFILWTEKNILNKQTIYINMKQWTFIFYNVKTFFLILYLTLKGFQLYFFGTILSVRRYNRAYVHKKANIIKPEIWIYIDWNVVDMVQ